MLKAFKKLTSGLRFIADDFMPPEHFIKDGNKVIVHPEDYVRIVNARSNKMLCKILIELKKLPTNDPIN